MHFSSEQRKYFNLVTFSIAKYIFVIINVSFGSLDLILGILPSVLCIFQSIKIWFTISLYHSINNAILFTTVCLYRWDFQEEAKVKALSFFFSLLQKTEAFKRDTCLIAGAFVSETRRMLEKRTTKSVRRGGKERRNDTMLPMSRRARGNVHC